MAGDAGELKAILNLENKQFLDAMKEMSASVDAGTSQSASQFGQLTGAVGAIGGALAGLGIADKLTDLVSSSFEAAEKVEGLKVAFQNLNGATEETDKLFTSLSDLEAQSIFDFEDVIGPAAQQMLSFGMSADQVDKSMKALVDTASALRLKPESIESMATALGKMSQETELSTKTMKSLQMEGVPAWDILAEKIGVDVPKAMELVKEGAISGKQAVAAMTEGMGERFAGEAQKLTGSWKGVKNAISQAVEDVQVSIGQTLGGVLEKLAPIFEKVVEWIKAFASWFTNLPEPIKTAVIVFAGIAAAVAAITAAIPAFLAAAGLIAGAFGGPVIAIAAVTAALVALGVWIADNWDPIVLTITQAWDGIVELWSAVWTGIKDAVVGVWNAIVEFYWPIWGPMITFFTTLWDALGPYFTQAWTAIRDFLSGLWGGIRDTAASIWNGIKEAIAAVLSWAEKIPGVGKLLNLGDTFTEAKQTNDALKEMAEATKEVGETAKKSGGQITLMAGNSKKASKEAEAAAKKARAEADKAATRQADAWDAAVKRYDKQLEESKKQLKWFEDANAKLLQMNTDLAKSNDELALKFGQANTAMHKAATEAVDIIVPAMQRLPPEIQAAINKHKDHETALTNLGITSKAKYDQVAADAKVAYDAVMGTGLASDYEKNNALVKLLEAQRAAAIANTGIVPAEIEKQLQAAKEKAEIKTPEIEGVFKNFGTNVSTAITNFAQDITKSLWEGDLSWGEKGKELLSSLGQAVTNSFIEPATAAISSFISGAIKDLLGGEGLGGVLDKIKGIGTSMTDLFGGGKDVAEKIPGVPDIPGGAKPPSTGAPGGGAPAGGGMMGMVNMITGVGSLISSVVGNFQMAGMNKTLDLIENYTRYLKIGLVTQGDSLLNDSHIIRNVMTDSVDNYWGTTVTFYNDFALKMDDVIARLTVIESKNYDIAAYASGMRTDISTALWKFDDMVAELQGLREETRNVNVSVQANGITTAEAARELGNQIAKNLSSQLVGSSLR